MSTRFAKTAMFACASAAAAILNVAVVAPAQAEAYDGNSVVVRYADLDLASKAGAAQLDRRIRNAAAEVCGPADMRVLEQATPARACRAAAIASAEPQVKLVLALADKSERFADAGPIRVAAN